MTANITHRSAISRRVPEFFCTSRHLNIRGRRECRALDAPAASHAKIKEAYEHSHHGHTGTPGIPHAMVLTVSFVLSPVIGLLPPSSRVLDAKLDASVEASGPHDFAVRISAVRQQHISVHRIPPRACDDRETPPCGAGREGYRFDLGPRRRGIFLNTGLDRANQIELFAQITLSAPRNL